jgi:YfiH family protein
MYHVQGAQLLSINGVSHYFMGRKNGTSPPPWASLNVSFGQGDVEPRVKENRARICAFAKIAPDHLYTTKQVHGKGVRRVVAGDLPAALRGVEADAIWTTDKGLLLGVETADCVPVLMAHKEKRAVAAIHAGWRGLAGGVIENCVEQMCEALHARPEDWVAAVGPHIGPCCYEVGEDVASHARAVCPQSVKHFEGEKSFVDLGLWAKTILDHLGVKSIDMLSNCTATNVDLYFSSRKENRKTGRQLSCIAILS